MLNIASDSRPGSGENQDVLLVLPHPKAPQLLLVAIADGQGGRPGGKEAAKTACQIIIDKAASCRPRSLLWKRNWKRLLAETDHAVHANKNAGFTTLIAFALKGNQLVGVASGDSALMVITTCKDELLSEGQMKNPPIGSTQASAFTFTCSLRPPWTLLAMTDGVWKYAGWDEIRNIALASSTPTVMIESIRSAASSAGSLQDDFTLLVVYEDGKAQNE